MAEVTGQIGNEYVELSNAASEATLQELVKAVNRLAGKTGRDDGKSGEEVEKFHDQLKQTEPVLKRRTKAERQQTKQTSKNEGALAREVEKRFQATKEIDKAKYTWRQAGRDAISLGTAFVNTIDEFANYGDSLKSASAIFSRFPIIGGLLATSFGAIAGNAERLFASFQNAAAVGATFGGSVTEMVNSASAAGLTFDQFSGIIAKAGPGLALLGRGSEDGARRFAQLSKQMRIALRDEGLANLGYSAETANEGMARYVSRLARTGVAQQMTTEQLTRASTDYLKNLDALSKLTGKSKDALQDEQDALMNQAKFRALLQGKDVKTQEQLNRLIMTVPEGMRAGAMEVLATGTATTRAGQEFLAYMERTGQNFMHVGQQVRAGGLLTEEATDRHIDAMVAEARELTSSPLGQTLAMFDENLNDFMVGAFDLAAITVSAAETRRATREATESTDEMAGSLVTAKQRLAEFSNEISESLAKFMPKLEPLLTGLLDLIEGPLKNTLEFLHDNFDSLGKAVAGVMAAIVGVKAYRGLSSLGGLFGGDDESGKSRKRKKRGKGGGIGGALGGLVGGVLTGIATGLKAFANPLVIKGAVILGAAIGIIGAAIAGASWILGKSLPTLAEGLKSFEELDGAKLSSAGKGMLLLGAGLAVFGVGGVAGSLGTAASNLIDGVNKFFGGETPFEKLERFSQLNIDAERVKANAESLILFGEAMAKMGAGQAAGAWGNAAESFVSFFTGSSIDKLQRQIIDFQKISYDKDKIRANADGLSTFVEAMAVVSDQAFVNSLNSLSNLSTGGLFSSSPLETLSKQVREYQKLGIDRNKINTTAEGLRTFVQSMTELGTADLDISAALNLEPSIRGLRNINTQLESYITNLRNIKKELPPENKPPLMNRMFGSGGAEAAADRLSAQGQGQDQTGTLVNSLNTKLDQLISINSELTDLNRQQLTVQRGLSGNLLESF